MAFRARKTRERRAQQPVIEGRQLIPSAPDREWYERELKADMAAMVEDYKAVVEKAFKKRDVKEFYAADAGPTSIFKRMLNEVKAKWAKHFNNRAKLLAAKMVEKADGHSKRTVNFSIKALGVAEPKTTYNENIKHTLQAAEEFNRTLISGLGDEAHDKMYNAIMTSLTSPDPAKQGQPAIIAALHDIGISSKKRCELIARDQTSKVYSSLNVDRMKQNGVTKFKWVHSSAGTYPRESHLAKDGMIFTMDDPRLWQGPKGDQGPPGWAINCRCRAIPILDIEE